MLAVLIDRLSVFVLAASLFRPDLQSPAKEKLLGMAEAGLFYRSNVLPVSKPTISEH